MDLSLKCDRRHGGGVRTCPVTPAVTRHWAVSACPGSTIPVDDNTSRTCALFFPPSPTAIGISAIKSRTRLNAVIAMNFRLFESRHPRECSTATKEVVRITLNLASFLRTLATRRPMMVAASEGRFKFCVYGETPQSKISFRRRSRNYRKGIERKTSHAGQRT